MVFGGYCTWCETLYESVKRRRFSIPRPFPADQGVAILEAMSVELKGVGVLLLLKKKDLLCGAVPHGGRDEEEESADASRSNLNTCT